MLKYIGNTCCRLTVKRTILKIAHSVLWLTEGTTRTLGTPDDARRNDAFAREYLGPLALPGDIEVPC